MGIQNLSSTDLNLLPVLQMLLEEKNVTRAAGRLNLSQPAISRSLSRLRSLFDDPLFTRTPKGLAPTPRAEALSLQLQRSLQELSQLIEPDEFIPGKATNTFRLATTDFGSIVFLPSVTKRLRAEAPGVNLEIIPWKERFVDEMDQQDLDLALCGVGDAPAAIHGRGVGDDRFVCLVGKAHPQSGKEMTRESYAQSSHALITMGGERKGAVDHMLEKQGLKRRVALRVPHFVAAPGLIVHTDLVLTLPYCLAARFAHYYDLDILAFPFEQKPFSYSIIWHERYIKDPCHRWFRQLVYNELTDLIQEMQSQNTFLDL